MIGAGGRGCPALSISAKCKAALREGLDDLVDRLLAEVRDGGELALRLRHEVADRLDTGTLEAVVGAAAPPPHPARGPRPLGTPARWGWLGERPPRSAPWGGLPPGGPPPPRPPAC